MNKLINIPDNGKSNHIKIEANTTQSGSRVLCGVRLSFEHQFADELRFVLISPSGKKITLKAGKTASSKTSGSSWNVLFIRQEDIAHPDDFKKPVWKDNKWSKDQQYVGSYYPDDTKGLALFDGDNLTGTWNLVYTDLVKGGEGVLKSFSLLFCDPPAFCNTCQISRDFLSGRDWGTFCGGDPSLGNIQPAISPVDIEPGFDYLFMVLNGKKQIIVKGRNPDLSQLNKGEYQIIGVQYRTENLSILSAIKNLDDLEDLFYGNQSQICGAISRASNNFTIQSNPGVKDEVLEVYGRNHIILNGQYISSDQTVMQSFVDQNGCDSLVRTLINFKNYNPDFTQNNLYDCEHNSIQVSVKTEQDFPVQRWFTKDGKINNQSDIKSQKITADAPGTYFVVFEIEDYLDTISYTLRTDPKSPVITLSNEYELCSSNPLTLTIGSNFDEATIKPSSTATLEGQTLIITEPDLYTVTVKNENCELVKHILVQPAAPSESVFIEDAILSCPENPVGLTPTLTREYENYSWSLEGQEMGLTKNLSVNKPGLYTFRAYDGNQCGISGTAWVENNVSQVNLQISGPKIINCKSKAADNRLIASYQGDFDALWTLPDGATVTDKEVPVDQDGTYQVKISDQNGCIFSATHDVSTVMTSIDFEVPSEITIPCNSTSQTITANVMAQPEDYTIVWKGASGGNPGSTATVNSPGIVSVTVTHKISQCSQTKNIRVKNEEGKPELSFDSNLEKSITCDNPVRKIPVTINNCTGCTPVLHPNKDITFEMGSIVANGPGTVNIGLDNGTCMSNQTVTFPDATQSEKINIYKENIGCSGKSGRIEIKNKGQYSSLEFQSSQNTFPYTVPLTNITSPVTYTVIYTDKENGCSSQQEINVQTTSEPPALEYEPVQYLNCQTGKALLTIRGSDITRIVWFDGNNNELADGINELEVSTAGVYRFVAYNEADCFQDLTIKVKDDRSTPSLQLEPEYYLPCEESSKGIIPDFDTTALDSVNWYGPGGWRSSSFFPTLEQGDYRVLIVGKNGCKTTEKTSVIQSNGGNAPDIIAPPITCRTPYSKIHLADYSDIDQIQWIDESGQASLSDSFNVFNPGKISLTIVRTNGCRISSSLTVIEDKETVPFKINEPIINCNTPDPKLRAEATQPIDRKIFYQWYFGNTPVGNDATYDIEYPGDYRVEVSYDNGCLDSLRHTVKIDTSAVHFRLRTDTISCARSKIQLRNDINTDQISKATWSGPSGFSSTAIRPNFQIPGSYQVVYFGENGCEGQAEMEIYGDVIPPDVDSVDYLSLGCGGKKVDLTYFTSDSVKTQYWQLPGGEVVEESTIPITNKGNYKLYLEGENGCEKIDTFVIDQTIKPKFDLMVEDAGCDDHMGNVLLLPVNDTFMALWIDPTTMDTLATSHQSPELAAGSYLVTVINPYNNCDTTTTFEIKDVSNILEAEISIDDSLRCERSQANLMSTIFPSSQNYVYEWRYGNQTSILSEDSVATDISREGTYYLTATDTLNFCSTEAQYQNVRAPSRLQAFDLFLREPACDLNKAGYAIMDSLIGASDMDLVTYSINQGPFLKRDTFPFLYANEAYSISAKDQYGCTLDTILMPELRGIMDRLAPIPDTTINSGDSIDFNDPAFKISYTSPDAPFSEQYTWILNPDTLSCDYDCTDPIVKQLYHTRTVSAHMTNQFGCSIADTFQVHVREGDVLGIPNGIIPGSSQPENANVCIYTNEYVAAIELFVVFNRLGKIIFKRSNFNPRGQQQNLTNCWNGRDSQNTIYPPGNYNYYVRYKTVYGATKERYGNIFLIR